MIIVSFGGYWSVLPVLIGKVFKKPTGIILHGTDCASIPTLNYGSLRKPLLKLACKVSYKYSTILLPVSQSLVETKNKFDLSLSVKEYFQGYKSFFPEVKTANFVIENCVDHVFWVKQAHIRKDEKLFIAVFSKKQYYLKGGDLIVKVAKYFPDYKFNIIGCDQPEYLTQLPENITFLGKMSKEALRDMYSCARFHLQLSTFEGFGLALCEAMLCECVPIVSNVNILPNIVEQTGFIINKKDVELFQQIIAKVIHNKDNVKRGEEARMLVKKKFSSEKRREKLLQIIRMHT